jgi:predicted nucleotidyltransferase component of viral defense system
LDFSTTGNPPTGSAMESAIDESCKIAESMLHEYAPVEIPRERHTERDLHPLGQEAFTIRARLPWQKQPHTRVIIETAIDKKVLKPAKPRRVIHEYGEPLHVEMPVYALEELVAEKLRAILQHIEKLEGRGWSRSRARDYYDIWRVLCAYEGELDFTGFVFFLKEKCSLRNVTFRDANDFFKEPMMTYVARTWEQKLGPPVPSLPAFDTVIHDLRPRIQKLLSLPAS